MTRDSKSRPIAILFALLLAAPSCAVPTYDITTDLGRQAIVDAANQALTKMDCGSAYSQVFPAFNSIYSTNQLRLLMASTYGCYTGMSALPTLIGLIAGGGLAGPAFWRFMSQKYPSTLSPNDKVVEYGELSIDALQSVVKPGVVVVPGDKISSNAFNVGSSLASDRVEDANMMMFFTSMSVIGGIQNRYGAPNATFQPTNVPPLPWNTAAAVDSNGCAYGSALVNLADAMGVVAGKIQLGGSQAIVNLVAQFQTALYASCNFGCTGAVPPTGVASGCALASCGNCPQTLRDRTTCTGLVTDANSCAAAGLVNFINTNALGWN